MKLIWTRLASADRRKIRDLIAQDNPAAAMALDLRISHSANRLIDHPDIGRVGWVEGTRELVAHQNYFLVYDVTGNRIRVLRVLHAARKWP